MRQALGLSQEQLAEKLGYTRRSVIRYEDGSSPVPSVVEMALKQLADAGFDGFCFSVVAYNEELPYVIEHVLPRLERLGLRQPQRW